jgi:undecaprenyl diphosphate synthase
MGLFLQYLEKELISLSQAGVRLKVIGDISGFDSQLQERIHSAQYKTTNNDVITLAVAANYGGHWDIVNSMREWMKKNPNATPAELNDIEINKGLATAELPQLDLLIRTGGERRISNFLLWQAAYAELYFTDVLWPDFNETEFVKAVAGFGGRERRDGRVL